MKHTYFVLLGVLLVLVIFLLLYSGIMTGVAALSRDPDHGTALAQEKRISKVIFKVNCYDEGKTALQGLKGIYKIETGFHYIHETDTVYYYPDAITIKEMESALKKAGTYAETITEKERN